MFREEDRLFIQLNMKIPKSNEIIQGTIDVRGVIRKNGTRETDTLHEWVPILMPAIASVNLKTGSINYNFDGRAYHDHNSSLVPLHDLNIKRWWWGRVAFDNHELIWYSLLPKNDEAPIHMSISINENGETTILENKQSELIGMKTSRYGLTWPSQFILTAPWEENIKIDVCSKIDDGPFYHRYIVKSQTKKGQGFGYAEQVVPDLVDKDWMKPLIKMRVASPNRNSFWLPLFSGPKKGRWGRLIMQLFYRVQNQHSEK